MKVRMLIPAGGADISLNIGDPYECPADEAKRMIDAGIAEPWTDVPADETAVDPQAGKETRKARKG